MSRVRKTVQATKDLDDIWFYIAADNLTAADNLIDKIVDDCALLADNPLLGRARPELAPDLRSFPVRNYILFYLLKSDGIELVRVLHGARDIDGEKFHTA